MYVSASPCCSALLRCSHVSFLVPTSIVSSPICSRSAESFTMACRCQWPVLGPFHQTLRPLESKRAKRPFSQPSLIQKYQNGHRCNSRMNALNRNRNTEIGINTTNTSTPRRPLNHSQGSPLAVSRTFVGNWGPSAGRWAASQG